MMTKSCLVCFVVLLATTYAAELKCPQNTRGTFPACKCLNGAKYDSNYNWCVSDLRELDGNCPADGPGIFPNCDCGHGKSFDSIKNVCYTKNRSVCPSGATGTAPNCDCGETFAFDEVHWYCRPWYLSTTRPPPSPRTYKPPPYVPRCAGYEQGVYPDCVPIPCGNNSLNPRDFQPHCRYNVTYYDYVPCPEGQVGSPPNCYKPCPAYHTGRYPDCQRIKCQTGPGWAGKYAPDCKFTPSCPPEFPGTWPYCDIYKATTESNTYLPPKPTPTYLPPTTTTPKPTTTTPRPTTTTQRSTTPFVPSTYLPPTTPKPTTTTPRPTTTTTQRSTTPFVPITYLPPSTTTTTTTTTTTPKPTTTTQRSTTTTRRSTTPYSASSYLPPYQY